MEAFSIEIIHSKSMEKHTSLKTTGGKVQQM